MTTIRPFFVLVLIVGAMLTTMPAAAAEPAGRVEKIRGEAIRAGSDGTQEALQSGSIIYVGDVITTGDESRLRVRFSDTSSLQLSDNAEFVIDELVHQSPGEPGNQALEVAEGVFRFISGAIAAADNQNISLTTPVATIGIRGTNVVFGILTVGMPVGQPHYGFQIWDGAVEISTLAGSVVLDEPGEGTFLPLTEIAAPTPVRQWTEEEAAEARNLVSF